MLRICLKFNSKLVSLLLSLSLGSTKNFYLSICPISLSKCNYPVLEKYWIKVILLFQKHNKVPWPYIYIYIYTHTHTHTHTYNTIFQVELLVFRRVYYGVLMSFTVKSNNLLNIFKDCLFTGYTPCYLWGRK